MDALFNSDVSVIYAAHQIALQSDGKVIVSMDQGSNNLFRLNVDGTTDASFDAGEGSDGILSLPRGLYLYQIKNKPK